MNAMFCFVFICIFFFFNNGLNLFLVQLVLDWWGGEQPHWFGRAWAFQYVIASNRVGVYSLLSFHAMSSPHPIQAKSRCACVCSAEGSNSAHLEVRRRVASIQHLQVAGNKRTHTDYEGRLFTKIPKIFHHLLAFNTVSCVILRACVILLGSLIESFLKEGMNLLIFAFFLRPAWQLAFPESL